MLLLALNDDKRLLNTHPNRCQDDTMASVLHLAQQRVQTIVLLELGLALSTAARNNSWYIDNRTMALLLAEIEQGMATLSADGLPQGGGDTCCLLPHR